MARYIGRLVCKGDAEHPQHELAHTNPIEVGEGAEFATIDELRSKLVDVAVREKPDLAIGFFINMLEVCVEPVVVDPTQLAG